MFTSCARTLNPVTTWPKHVEFSSCFSLFIVNFLSLACDLSCLPLVSSIDIQSNNLISRGARRRPSEHIKQVLGLFLSFHPLSCFSSSGQPHTSHISCLVLLLNIPGTPGSKERLLFWKFLDCTWWASTRFALVVPPFLSCGLSRGLLVLIKVV